jgi:hypothetical protein
MKKFLAFYLLLITLFSFSQERINIELGDFNSLKVFSGLHVKLIKSDKNRVEVKGPQSEAVVIKNVNGLLKISVKLPEVFESDNTLIKLYYKNDLDFIDANEGAIITSKEIIIQDFLELRAQEGAQIEIKLQVDILKIKAVTGAEISVLGKTNSQSVIVNTGGLYKGFSLLSKKAVVIASTGGEVEISASDFLKATAKLKGIIIYKIKPKKIIKKEILTGEIYFIKNYINSNGNLIYSD